jgi:hypothetical protein
MKYAIIGPRGAINRITDTEPKAPFGFEETVQDAASKLL